MPKPIHVLKPTFSGGEFAPSLYARVDLQRYSTGCMTLRNFIVHPHGGASNRPGTHYIATAKYADHKARLVPFEFSTEQAYVIEFGEYYCRFYMDGGQIVAPDVGEIDAWAEDIDYQIGDFVKVTEGDPAVTTVYRSKTDHTSDDSEHLTPPGNTDDWEESSIYEIETPYAEEDLPDLKFAQSADVLYITHPDYAPRTLSRYSHISWRLELYPYEEGPFMPMNINTALTLEVSALTGTGKNLVASEDLFTEDHVGALFKLLHEIPGQVSNESFTGVADGTSISCFSTWRLITHGTWTGKIRVEKSIDDGSTWIEIRSFSSDDDNNINTYGTEDADRPFLIRVVCYARDSGTINADLTTDAYSHVGIVKIVDYTSATQVTVDILLSCGSTGETPDWAEGSWSEVRGWPKTCAFYQDRLVFASTYAEPQSFWATKTSNYVNFGRNDPLIDSDGISVNLPSRKVNGIRHILPLDDIIALTSSSEWKIGPGTNSIMSPTSVIQKFQGARGSSEVAPVLIGSRIIFIQPKGTIVRDMNYDYASDKYDGDPLSLLSTHLFQNHQIVDMAYQPEPDSILWCIRDDGIALSMTYLKEQEVVAWSWHDTDGEFEAVCSIPGDTYDEVWFIVKRGTSRFIERLPQRMVSLDPRQQFFMDAGISYDVPLTINDATKASPVVITTEDEHGLENGDLVDILNVEGMTELNGVRFKVANKTADTFELTDPEDDTNIDGSEYGEYESGGEARKCYQTFSGLDYFEDRTLAVLADGNVIDGMVVEGGQITLPVYASIVHMGLPFISDLQTLNVELNLPDGTTQGRKMTIPEVQFSFLNSAGGWIGPDVDNLDEITMRTDEAQGSPIDLYTGPYRQTIAGDYKEGGRVFFRQTDPLPVTILAIIPIIALGE